MNDSSLQPRGAAVTAPTLSTVDAHIYPRGGLDVLSREEVARLRDASGGMHDHLLRRCALAVMASFPPFLFLCALQVWIEGAVGPRYNVYK